MDKGDNRLLGNRVQYGLYGVVITGNIVNIGVFYGKVSKIMCRIIPSGLYRGKHALAMNLWGAVGK